MVVEAVEDVWRGYVSFAEGKGRQGRRIKTDHSGDQADHLIPMRDTRVHRKRNKSKALKARVSCTCLRGISFEGEGEGERKIKIDIVWSRKERGAVRENRFRSLEAGGRAKGRAKRRANTKTC